MNDMSPTTVTAETRLILSRTIEIGRARNALDAARKDVRIRQNEESEGGPFARDRLKWDTIRACAALDRARDVLARLLLTPPQVEALYCVYRGATMRPIESTILRLAELDLICFKTKPLSDVHYCTDFRLTKHGYWTISKYKVSVR